MLLEFKTKNFKSFKDEMVFSMIPAPKQKGLDYSILTKKIGSKIHKGLCSAVVYGPNAAGKTNIIGAMEVFKSIIFRGHIRNGEELNSPNVAAKELELIPNIENNENSPVEFSLKFIEEGLLFEYQVSLDIGVFLKAGYSRKILSEVLSVNEKLVFSRTGILEFGDFKNIKEYLVNAFEDNANGVTTLAKSNLNDEELFLTNGFKAMFSAKIVGIINKWLEARFMVIYRADKVKVTKNLSDPQKKTAYLEKRINEAVQMFGINSNKLGYVVADDDSKAKLCSIFEGKHFSNAVLAEVYESYGTIRFVNIFALVETALSRGATLVVDEFDASIHPMALMSIINIFHNNDININKAQLIFNTHNPIFLNSNLFEGTKSNLWSEMK